MKHPKVIQYKNLEVLLAELKDKKMSFEGLALTATSDMARVLNDAIMNDKEDVRPTIGTNDLINKLLSSWYDSSLALEQVMKIGEIIDSLKGSEISAELINALKKNKREILMSIRNLTEIGILPDNIQSNYQDVSLFKTVYEKFLENDLSLNRFHAKMLYEWGEKENFKELLNEALNQKRTKTFDEKKNVYLVGFYYITPIQSRLVYALENMGANIYYVNNYDECLPGAYKVWNYKFPKNKGDVLNVIGTESESFFGDLFENNNKYVKPKNNITVIKYDDVFSFVNSFTPDKKENMHIFTPATQETRDLFDTFFPNESVKKHLLSYPIGQYLFSLYKMWDGDQGELIFDNANIRQCIASGWAGSDKVIDSRPYLYCFDRIESYFSDCKTMKEWTNRAELLLNVRQKIVPLFNRNNVSADKQKWHDSLSNPLLGISAFACKEQDVRMTINILKSIMDDANSIFVSDSAISIEAHFKNVAEMLRAKANHEELYKEETEIIKTLFQRLKSRPKYIEQCTNENLADAMSFFLGGQLDDLNNDVELGDGETDTLVTSLASIDTASCLYKDKNIEICLCDSSNMPGIRREYTWPLSKDVFEKCTALNIETKTALNDYLYLMEGLGYRDRYCFYLALQLPNVQISWIASKNGKELSPSSYIKLLENVYDIKPMEKHTIMINTALNVSLKKSDAAGNQNMKFPDGAREITDLNDKLCKRRNIYDFYLKPMPTFSSKYHLNFYFKYLIVLIYSTTKKYNYSIEDVANNVFSIFPSFNESERQQIVDFAGRTKLSGHDLDNFEFDSQSYKNFVFYLKYLNQNAVEMVLNGKKNNGINKCNYCQHKDYCYYTYRGDQADE